MKYIVKGEDSFSLFQESLSGDFSICYSLYLFELLTIVDTISFVRNFFTITSEVGATSILYPCWFFCITLKIVSTDLKSGLATLTTGIYCLRTFCSVLLFSA